MCVVCHFTASSLCFVSSLDCDLIFLYSALCFLIGEDAICTHCCKVLLSPAVAGERRCMNVLIVIYIHTPSMYDSAAETAQDAVFN